MFLPMPVAMTTTRHATCAGCCPSPFSACFLRRRFPRVGCCPSRIIRACRARPVDPRDQRRTGPLFAFSIFVHDTPHGCVTVSVVCVCCAGRFPGAVVHCCLNKPRLPNMCTVRAARAGRVPRAGRRARGAPGPRPGRPAGLAGGGWRGGARGAGARRGHRLGTNIFAPDTGQKATHAPRTPRTRRVDILSPRSPEAPGGSAVNLRTLWRAGHTPGPAAAPPGARLLRVAAHTALYRSSCSTGLAWLIAGAW